MNIKDAKEQIKNAMTAYFTKDEAGEYEIPIEKQRPVFLMGPPGIGKTAVMEQVAAEMGVGLLSYSMTHHTRQSALGLPFIVHKNYGGREYEVSEYTMSEIIAAVYDLMENTGVKEGILFLDEINCVSETLAPVMLQFLQYKIFGRHRVPKGWIVVTAGNPPEYNNSVREFDIVTWDRLKRIDIEPDFECWKEYAYKTCVHPSVLTYLEIKTQDFYSVESTVDGKSFVTARGWEDLSRMISLYEKNKITVDEKLISQYIQNKKISRNFFAYYDLFNKYKSDYKVDEILSGKVNEVIKKRATEAHFDERLSLLGLILDSITLEIRGVMEKDSSVVELMSAINEFRLLTGQSSLTPSEIFKNLSDERAERIENGKTSGSLSSDDIRILKNVISKLELLGKKCHGISDGAKALKTVKSEFDKLVKELKKDSENAGKMLSNVFVFCEEVFSDGHELLILVTELTANCHTAKFIGRYGNDEYYKHNENLLFSKREKDILKEIENFDIG